MVESNLSGLELSVDTLIKEAKRLAVENQALRNEQESLRAEKTQLQEKNRLACTRLEKIVEKLRTLEDQ